MTPAYGLAGPLGTDLALLRSLRAEGHLVGLALLEALVQVRRAREHGDGSPRLVEAVQRLVAGPSLPETQPTATACPDCHGESWRPLPTGGRACGNCGLVERGTA